MQKENMISIADLIRIKPLINVKQLAKDIDMPYVTIDKKLRDKSELKVDQSQKIEDALKEKYGITIEHRG